MTIGSKNFALSKASGKESLRKADFENKFCQATFSSSDGPRMY